MKMHFDYAHSCLLAKRKLQLIEKVISKVFEANHSNNKGRKGFGGLGLKSSLFFINELLQEC